VRETKEGLLLRIFVGESDRCNGRPLYEAILELLRSRGLAGATVLRGVAGFGRTSVVHTAHLLRMSEDLPMIIECVDVSPAIEAVLPDIEEMVSEGMVTVERVQVHVYRGRGED